MSRRFLVVLFALAVTQCVCSGQSIQRQLQPYFDLAFGAGIENPAGKQLVWCTTTAHEVNLRNETYDGIPVLCWIPSKSPKAPFDAHLVNGLAVTVTRVLKPSEIDSSLVTEVAKGNSQGELTLGQSSLAMLIRAGLEDVVLQVCQAQKIKADESLGVALVITAMNTLYVSAFAAYNRANDQLAIEFVEKYRSLESDLQKLAGLVLFESCMAKSQTYCAGDRIFHALDQLEVESKRRLAAPRTPLTPYFLNLLPAEKAARKAVEGLEHFGKDLVSHQNIASVFPEFGLSPEAEPQLRIALAESVLDDARFSRSIYFHWRTLPQIGILEVRRVAESALYGHVKSVRLRNEPHQRPEYMNMVSQLASAGPDKVLAFDLQAEDPIHLAETVRLYLRLRKSDRKRIDAYLEAQNLRVGDRIMSVLARLGDESTWSSRADLGISLYIIEGVASFPFLGSLCQEFESSRDSRFKVHYRELYESVLLFRQACVYTWLNPASPKS